MAKTDLICDHCRTKVDAVFNPTTGTRDLVLISGTRIHDECCFVADEIHFTGNSQLVFAPREKRYCQEYFVVCRKLVIQGGRQVNDPTPCSPDDPGGMYNNNNVITWQDRLVSAAVGNDFAPPKAATGTSHNRNVWSDVGQGSPHGADGGDGANGAAGNDGATGMSAPSCTVLALEVEAGAGDHLTIDFDGQNGGEGGRAQEGGEGGDGMGGRDGQSDTSWPGEGCDRQPGNGGNGGDGGRGGVGGRGGRGGNAGTITLVSTPPNISSGGVFLGSRFTYVNDGGDGGKGGKGAVGGGRGKKGIKGKKTQHCDEASDGQDGERGLPDSSLQAVDGPGGPGGAGVSPAFEPVRRGTCADQIPFPPMSIASVTPNSGAQGTTVRVTIAGIGFDPAAAGFTVEVSGFGVSTARVASPPAPAHTSSLTTWDFTIANLAPKTARDVTVKNTLANKADLVGGFTVT